MVMKLWHLTIRNLLDTTNKHQRGEINREKAINNHRKDSSTEKQGQAPAKNFTDNRQHIKKPLQNKSAKDKSSSASMLTTAYLLRPFIQVNHVLS